MTSDAIDKAWEQYRATQFGPPQALRKREFIAGWEAARSSVIEECAQTAENMPLFQREGYAVLNRPIDVATHIRNLAAKGAAPELSREEANRVHAFGLDIAEEGDRG